MKKAVHIGGADFVDLVLHGKSFTEKALTLHRAANKTGRAPTATSVTPGDRCRI